MVSLLKWCGDTYATEHHLLVNAKSISKRTYITIIGLKHLCADKSRTGRFHLCKAFANFLVESEVWIKCHNSHLSRLPKQTHVFSQTFDHQLHPQPVKKNETIAEGMLKHALKGMDVSSARTVLSDETLSNRSSKTKLPNVAAPRANGKLPANVAMHLYAMLKFGKRT
jgi:hypothetical protein